MGIYDFQGRPWFPAGWRSSSGIVELPPGPARPLCLRCRPELRSPVGSSCLSVCSVRKNAAALQSGKLVSTPPTRNSHSEVIQNRVTQEEEERNIREEISRCERKEEVSELNCVPLRLQLRGVASCVNLPRRFQEHAARFAPRSARTGGFKGRSGRGRRRNPTSSLRVVKM